jgi:hypothetical protein
MGTKLLPVVSAFCVKHVAGLVCVSVNSDTSWYILFVWAPGLWSVDILYSSWTVNG